MLDPRVVALATGTNFCTLTTFLPDGHPQTHVMWVDVDDGRLKLNTEVHRQKFRNIERDPRVTVTIWDATDPYTFAEVRGNVVGMTRGPEARAHIDRLSRKYTGKDFTKQVVSERVILEVEPTRQVFH